MSTNIAQWGSSLAVRIPKTELDVAGFIRGTVVEVIAKKDELIIKKAKPKYTLEELVSGITEENRHSEIQYGAPVGNEHW